MKVSVVIPVYNAEEYLLRCVESVQHQSYTEWEMVLVDDGSIDNSLVICQEKAAEDCRIKVIHQSNKGPGEARNVGIAATTGDYIVFVDADDPYGWEVISEDELPSTQWEHTLLMTEHGVEVLTY